MSTWVLLSPHWPSRTPQHLGATAGLGAGGRWGGPAPSSRSPAERALESGAAAAAAVGAALFAANEARTSAPGTQRDTPLGTRSGLCRDSHAGLSAPTCPRAGHSAPAAAPRFIGTPPGPVLRAESPRTDGARPPPARGPHPAGTGRGGAWAASAGGGTRRAT